MNRIFNRLFFKKLFKMVKSLFLFPFKNNSIKAKREYLIKRAQMAQWNQKIFLLTNIFMDL